MKKTLPKLRTENGKWYVDEGYKVTICDTALDAWSYLFLLKEIRPKAPHFIQSIYPVRSLNPIPSRGCKNAIHARL